MAETTKSGNGTATGTTTSRRKAKSPTVARRHIELQLPSLDLIDARVLGNSVRQLAFAGGPIRGYVEPFQQRAVKGVLFTPDAGEDRTDPILIISKKTSAGGLPSHILLAPHGPPVTAEATVDCRWLRPATEVLPPAGPAAQSYCSDQRQSWAGCFTFKREQRKGGKIIPGLRSPQIGALHNILGHWTVTDDPGTIVMPTGTGKTETMLALLVAETLLRVLVIVPTDPLRQQIAWKFLSLGVLRNAGVIAKTARLPVVGTLYHKPKTVGEVDEFFARCNVIVTTANIAGDCCDEVSARIAELCSHLIVDEAHHVRAPTWERVRDSFKGKPILQFTATPYRNDRKLIDGNVAYNYPLKKAQEEGYFRPIQFKPVEEYNEDLGDERIAEAAIAQLDADLRAGHDHLVMARCASITRAIQLHTLYKRLAAKHAPVLAHSELSATDVRQAVDSLRSRRSRIVVCVSMFGEGFDLPELKIAALHDVHKSLAVTLQFTGRFTRTKSNVGDATVIANIADVAVEEALQELYSEEPDWNLLLRDLSQGAVAGHGKRTEFQRAFTQQPDHIPLQNVFPKMSTVVFRTRCQHWHPERAQNVLSNVFDKPALNPKSKVLMLVTRETDPVGWGRVRGISNTTYDLYLLHWDDTTQLLYIHSSNKETIHEALAKAVCGPDVAPVKGEVVYRALHGINRLILMNLGLGHTLSRAVRFTMHVGPDIKTGLSEAQVGNKIKTNLFGRGYAGGDKASVGCSRKGRIWSFHVAADISEWVDWCHQIGRKLQNDRIDVEEILKGAIIPEPITQRPGAVPITVDWAEELLDRSEESVKLDFAGIQVPFYEVSIAIARHAETGPISFEVRCDRWPHAVAYTIAFGKGRVDYVPTGSAEPAIAYGRRKFKLSEYWQDESPFIRFHDGSFLWYDHYYPAPHGPREAFDRRRIDAWPWMGVDLKKESQTQRKFADSIQRHVIEKLLAETGDSKFDVVFDDDESGEAADVIAIRAEAKRILFRLYHCKFSKEETAGHRVKDMYEVCGQAQRSVYWKGQAEALLDHMLHRESMRTAKGGVSRFERGASKTLRFLKKKLRSVEPEFEIYVVQPGLSQAQAETGQLELLAVTEVYLKTTFEIALGVIASA